MLKLDADHVERLLLREAIDRETARRKKELPSDAPERIVDGHEDEFSERLKARCLAGYEVSTAQVVWASKGRYRFRPISAASLPDRCLYGALVSDATSDADDADPPFDDFSEFERAPLEDGSTKYIAFADVTAFYQYIDHSLVGSRIVDTTARPDASEAVRKFLTSAVGREFGLPQGPRSSDKLADLVLAPIERKLRRSGFTVARYSDDFRIGLKSRGAATEALELLADELMRLGLTLNEEKCKVFHRNTYEEHLGTLEEPIDRIFDQLHLAAERTPYGMIGIASLGGLQSGALEADFAASLQRLTDVRSSGNSSQRVIDRRIALVGLPRLAAWGSPVALDHAASILALDPSFARPYGRHLRMLARTIDDPASVQETLERIVTRLGPHPGPWQKIWILEPLLSPGIELSPPLKKWTMGIIEGNAPDILKARALQLLALHDAVSVQEAVDKLTMYDAAARVDAVIASALVPAQSAGDKRILQDVGADAPLNRWALDVVQQARDDLSWL